MAFTAGKKVLPGYTQAEGAKIGIVFDSTGPASYTAFTSPSTGGGSLSVQIDGLNLGGLDWLSSGVLDTTGQIIAYTYPINGGYGNSVPKFGVIYYSLVSATLGGQVQTAGAQIVTSTNLSSFSWRYRALGV